MSYCLYPAGFPEVIDKRSSLPEFRCQLPDGGLGKYLAQHFPGSFKFIVHGAGVQGRTFL
jgi:hypothetical protein